MLKPVALAVAALVLCFCAGSASAAALASASIDITKFAWYVDDGIGDPNPETDPLVTAALTGSAQNTTLTAGNDSTNVNVLLVDGGLRLADGQIGNRRSTQLSSSLDLGPTCVGTDCQLASQSGAPPPISTSASGQFANSDLFLDGFYANVPTVTTGGEQAKLLAEVSLPAVDPEKSSEAVALANWSSTADFTANATFARTYFAVEFVAQAFAQLSDDVGEGSATGGVAFQLIVLGRSTAAGLPSIVYFWRPQELNLTAATLTPGGSQNLPTSGTIYSYSSGNGMLPLTANYEYDVLITASTRSDVNQSPPVGPVPVPAPTALWLMAAGLLGLMASRRSLGLFN